MNKFLQKLAKIFLGLSMAAGVGVAVGVSKKAEAVHAATETITLQESTFSDMGNNNYESGKEYTGTVTSTSTSQSVNVGGHYITKNSGWQWQANNANVYNKTALSGRITNITVTQTGTVRAFTAYGGTEQLFSSSETGTGKSPSGDSLGAKTAATMSWDINANKDYTYFAIHKGANAGKVTSVVVTYEVASTKTLSSISVSTAPTKTTYYAGDYFDPTGLVIKRTYSDSTSDSYAYAGHTSEFTFAPSTSTALTQSNTSVTISYGGKSTSQAITVNAARTLSSISVSTAPTKVTYSEGEHFDPTGLVIGRTFSDSSSDTYTYANHTSEFTFSPSTSTALGTSDTSVTITYGGKSTTQAITVNEVIKYELISDASGLLSGKEYVISDETKTYFMAGQGSNNRSSVVGTVANNSVTFISTMETVTISEVTTDTFELKATSINAGYLYAAGASSSNYLRTENEHDADNNSKFSISISSGVATIVAQGTAARNNLRFNSGSDQLKFSCYASTSTLPKVSLWKKSGIDKLATPTPVYNDGNRTITWDSITGASSYQIKVDEGSWVTNVSSGYSVSSLTEGSHTVYLQAIGDGIDYSNSDVGNATFTVTVPTTISSVTITNGPSGAVTGVIYGSGITLTASATNAQGSGVSTFTWASSSTSVATIDSTSGELTYVGTGTTTITAESNYPGATTGSNIGSLQLVVNSVKGLVDLPLTVEEARTVATPATSASTTYYYYTEGIVSAIADETYSSQYGNKTFWLTSDGEDDETRELEIYRCKYLNDQSMTEEQFNSIEVGDTVVVYGQLRNYNSTLEYAQGCYLTSHIKPASTEPSVTITESDQSLDINDSPVTLHATIDNCEGVTISWSSSDANVATVTTPGATSTLTPVGGGTAIITVSITVDGDTYTDTIEVTVVAPLLKAGDTIVFYNDTHYLVEMGTLNGTAVGISGTTDDALVFTVENGSSSGTFSFIADGLYIAWSTGNTLSTSSTKNSNSSWTLDGNALTSVTIHNASDSSRKLQYNTGSPRFACYTSSQAAVSIEKRAPEADPTYVTLSSQTLTLEEEAEETLTITTDGRASAFKWHSSNEQIVTVVGGVVTAGTTPGSTTVVVYFDSNKNGSYDVGDTPQQSCTVTVTAPAVDYNSISVGGTGTKITSSNSSTFLQDGKKIIFTYSDTYTYGPFASYLSTISNSQAFPLTFSNNIVTIGDGTSELSFMIIELEEATGGFYFKMKDGKYLGHGSTTSSTGNFTSTTTPTLWTISVDASGGATIHSGEEAVRSYVRVNTGSDNRLKPYAVGTGVTPNIYSFVEYTDEANTYASDFLSSGVCGNNDNTKASSSIWSQLRTSYLGMTDGAKYLMSHATANEYSSQNIEKCAARYDRVIYLHYTAEPESYPDFMNRIANNYVTPRSTLNLLALVGVKRNTNTVAIIVIISMVSVTAIGGYFFLRKRKETNI